MLRSATRAYKWALEAQLAVNTGKPPTAWSRSVRGWKSLSEVFVHVMGPDPELVNVD